MSRGRDALKVGAAVAACGLCCPPLLLVPLGLPTGLGGSVTVATAALGAPGWVVVLLLLVTTFTAGMAWTRRRLRRRHTQVLVHGRDLLPLLPVTGLVASTDAQGKDVART